MAVNIRFSSGLGNQLFQFAAAYSLAKMLQTSTIGDASSFALAGERMGRVERRRLVLDQLCLGLDWKSVRPRWFYRLRGIDRLIRIVESLRFDVYECQGAWSRQFSQLRNPCVLRGYFQDVRYFKEYLGEVTSKIENGLRAACSGHWSPVESDCGVLHIRLGDYLSHPEFFPNWFQDYSRTACEKLLNETGSNRVLVFSDSPKSVGATLKGFGSRIEVVSPNPFLDGAADLLTMSTAKHIAIANSTFSWWSAAIATKNGAKVLAPVLWSTWCQNPAEQLYLESWSVCGDKG